ncbi:hypothetical protein CY34DRAFT_807525, partial [Suillus luteus UH-Slu-Lm8-n1]
AIAVEFVRTCHDSNTEGVDSSSWVLVSPTLMDVRSLSPNSENDRESSFDVGVALGRVLCSSL